jgi:hypothetical protein
MFRLLYTRLLHHITVDELVHGVDEEISGIFYNLSQVEDLDYFDST